MGNKILRAVAAIVLAYVFSLIFDFAALLWFSFISPVGGFASTLLFGALLGIASPLTFGLIMLFGSLLSKVIAEDKYLAIIPILIFIWHGIEDITTVYGAPKTMGIDVSFMHYVRATGMAIYIIAAYFWWSVIITNEGEL